MDHGLETRIRLFEAAIRKEEPECLPCVTCQKQPAFKYAWNSGGLEIDCGGDNCWRHGMDFDSAFIFSTVVIAKMRKLWNEKQTGVDMTKYYAKDQNIP